MAEQTIVVPRTIDRIIVLDFGSQTTHLIGRRIRDFGVYAEIVAGDTPVDRWLDDTVRGIILSGSPASVHDRDAPRPDPRVYRLGLPLLGICYGLQITAHLHGGTISRSKTREYGPARVTFDTDTPPFAGLDGERTTWMSHGDALESLPDGGRVTATSAHGVTAAVALPALNFVGLQFHPEVTHTEDGSTILEHFAIGVCGARRQWSIEDYLTPLSASITERVGDRAVLLLISGGVDSTVVAATLLRALAPHQVHLMYIDTGLMRAAESVEIKHTLDGLGAEHVAMIDASEEFLRRLAGVVDPERKRTIIGDAFIDVMEREVARRLSGEYLLAQGTLYTDLIESGHGVGRSAHRIKSHHNVATPLVARKREAGLIVEPLAALYKDEVRRLGRLLGVPQSVVERHPFPGPGLAVRILGEVTRERCDILREADRIYLEALRADGLYDKIWQAFAVLLPIRSVGVTGDARAYGDVVALRAVTSRDGMTADVFDFPPGFLRRVAALITNQVPAVGRVVYDCSGKPPATIEWE